MAIKEAKKLETQELESLLDLRKKNNNLIFQRGQVGLAEDNLQSQKDLLKEEIFKLTDNKSSKPRPRSKRRPYNKHKKRSHNPNHK